MGLSAVRLNEGRIPVVPMVSISVSELPSVYRLCQNVPNPFNPSTIIRYELPEPGDVNLTIYDVLGQEVRVLVSGMQAAGWYRAMWDGKDALGARI